MRRKRKFKKIKFKTKRIILLFTFILIFLTITLNINNIKYIYLSKTTGYNKNTIEVFEENYSFKEIKNYKYSKTLEKIINTEYYNSKYIKEYIDIEYKEDELFLKNTSLLLEKGYKPKEINVLNNKLNNNSINVLLENDYIKDITNIISINYFNEKNLKRYIDYYQNQNLDIETTITYVNIGLDNKYYSNIINIENGNDIKVLVNKYNKLNSKYVPKDLETISAKYGNGKLRSEARIAFEKMCSDAKKDNIKIYSGSSYRSYSYQLNLYNNYVKIDGIEETDTYAARAGHSEHQTGLAVDILNSKWDYIDENNKEYTWLVNNSYKYGYILRYPKGKEKITGYIYEPWHYRYLGIDLATIINDQDITYDEYIAKNSWQIANIIIKSYM